ncbi:putative hydrolase or acyltransferase of alpha/beta superfamily protein [Arthrobacter crystallopoietes BAB-32]|uniref:Putative hydrolase or acyltransferase of alpha/beta superfamily protein n=1 Tax=Arthrobacter crystallopoietes BAB-32 TaxID=1246476 RepID=N1V787_9MICC|nr:alpha/beta fold hydrolase [Arthrobacter crystallopoietes]EMY34113.1 putative hydrolase or acyltransferase of alpha/beta superfamily protein [Arthrobacter crystallopoietes BAB-32]
MGRQVQAGELQIWTEQVGDGPDVLLIGGLGDTVESWQFQLDGLADRYRLTAFDNRGAGRTAMPAEPLTVEAMADDAAAVLRALGIGPAHVAGFSGGSIIAQELALRHPETVRSLVLQSTWSAMDQFMKSMVRAFHWQAELAPGEREFLEGFFIWVYTARAHNDGMVERFIEGAMAFPHKQSTEDFLAFADACMRHETAGRLGSIAVPTLVLAGGADRMSRPELGRAVADEIPGARFEVMEEEAHQPFQEVPDAWNARVHEFWQDAERLHAGTTWS